jgi:hypothetical protein
MPGILHGRILLAATLVGWGVLSLIYVDFVSSLEPVPTSIPGFGFLAILNGLFLLAVGLLLMANFKVYPAAIAVAIMFALWILVLHVPGAFMNPALLGSPFWIRVFESLALGSGALILAGLASTPVPPALGSHRPHPVRHLAARLRYPALHLRRIYGDAGAALVSVAVVLGLVYRRRSFRGRRHHCQRHPGATDGAAGGPDVRPVGAHTAPAPAFHAGDGVLQRRQKRSDQHVGSGRVLWRRLDRGRHPGTAARRKHGQATGDG